MKTDLMDTDIIYCHDEKFIKKTIKVTMIEIAVPIMMTFFLIWLKAYLKIEDLDLLIAVAMIGVLMGCFGRNKFPEYISFCDETEIKYLGKTRKYSYSELDNIQYYLKEMKLWGVIPWEKAWVLELTYHDKNKYCFYGTHVDDFVQLKVYLEEKYTEFLKEKYLSLLIEDIDLNLGQGLRLKNGKLSIGMEASMPFNETKILRDERGYICLYHREKDGEDRLWIKLDPQKFKHIFVLEYFMYKKEESM